MPRRCHAGSRQLGCPAGVNTKRARLKLHPRVACSLDRSLSMYSD